MLLLLLLLWLPPPRPGRERGMVVGMGWGGGGWRASPEPRRAACPVPPALVPAAPGAEGGDPAARPSRSGGSAFPPPPTPDRARGGRWRLGGTFPVPAEGEEDAPTSPLPALPPGAALPGVRGTAVPGAGDPLPRGRAGGGLLRPGGARRG